MAYHVVAENEQKHVQWEKGDINGEHINPGCSDLPITGLPTLADIILAAQVEFPNISFEELEVVGAGYDNEFVDLRERMA